MKFLSISLACICCSGCFGERGYPMRDGDVQRTVQSEQKLTARPWLRRTHQSLKKLLPPGDEPALVCEEMLDADGHPLNVYQHFRVDPNHLDSIFSNYFGLLYSAHLSGPNYTNNVQRLDWHEFEEVWVPIDDKLSLHGQLGMARRGGQVIDADCIVILPGLMGHNDIRRTKDLAEALRASGFHVLAIEMRGHGQTNDRYPDIPTTFGVMESGDLLLVSEWLTSQPHVRRTGLVGFCWGANEAMVTTWYDNRPEKHISISEKQMPFMRKMKPIRHFEAGVIAFSPVIRYEEIIDATHVSQSKLQHPGLATLQKTSIDRMTLKQCAHPSGDLRTLTESEMSRSELNYPESADDTISFVRFWPHKGKPDGDKLEYSQVPILIVHAANDPLMGAQCIADLMAKVKNPNVAAVMLDNGGHVGFPAYARAYYFSLIVNFFDVQSGPAAVTPVDSVTSQSQPAAAPPTPGGCRVK